MDGRLDFIVVGVTNSFEMLGVPVEPNVSEESSDGDTDIEEALGCVDDKSDESTVGISDSFEILGVPVKLIKDVGKFEGFTVNKGFIGRADGEWEFDIAGVVD